MMKNWFSVISMLLIVIGALNWGLVGLFRFDLVASSLSLVGFANLSPVIYALVGFAGLFQLFRRDFYLPFLGKSVVGCHPLRGQHIVPSGADATARVHTGVPNASVMFWAAEKADATLDNPWDAYGKYTNAGVTQTDSQGVAVLQVRSPAAYRVPTGKVLQPHIHYRVCNKGMLGPVHTVYL